MKMVYDKDNFEEEYENESNNGQRRKVGTGLLYHHLRDFLETTRISKCLYEKSIYCKMSIKKGIRQIAMIGRNEIPTLWMIKMPILKRQKL